jgi:hypothetical protein
LKRLFGLVPVRHAVMLPGNGPGAALSNMAGIRAHCTARSGRPSEGTVRGADSVAFIGWSAFNVVEADLDGCGVSGQQ